MSNAFQGWAIVELMGHRRRAGEVSEVEQFGTSLLRIDIPTEDGATVTEFYGGGAIYALRPCEEEPARRAAYAIGDPRPDGGPATPMTAGGFGADMMARARRKVAPTSYPFSSPKAVRTWLRDTMAAERLTVIKWARLSGVPKGTLYRLLRDDSKFTPSSKTIHGLLASLPEEMQSEHQLSLKSRDTKPLDVLRDPIPKVSRELTGPAFEEQEDLLDPGPDEDGYHGTNPGLDLG